MKTFRRTLSDYFFESGNYKIVAAAIAFALWATVLVRRDVVYIKNVPLTYVLNDSQALIGDMPDEIEVRVAGTRATLKRFNARSVGPISIDVTNLTNGSHTISIPEDALQLPVGVRIVRITPSAVLVHLASTVMKQLPVIVPELPSEIREHSQVMSMKPEVVGVRIEKSHEDEVLSVTTDAIPFSDELRQLWEKKAVGEQVELLAHVHVPTSARVVSLGAKQTIILTIKKTQ